MHWIKEMQSAIEFIENRLTENLEIEEIAKNANSSSANFQRIFSIVTGMTVGDYIRSRRLSLAGKELAQSNAKVIDIALKYGYETAESFTKAFTRFHGVTPSAAKRRQLVLKDFVSLSIEIYVRGGFTMRRKLIPNVPEIPYDGNNATFFITLLEATLKGIGEDCDKAKLVALSGEGNRFCWTDGAWVFGNELTDSINETPFETESRVLSAIGWNAKYITVQRGKDGSFMNTDALQIRQDFISTIDRGFPVLMSHIYHVDYNLNVYFGYEDDGQKIIGYNYNNGFEAGVSKPIDASTPVAWDIYCDGLCQIDARKNPLPYYRSLMELFPQWRNELETAIQALDDCASYGGFLWSQGFTFDEAGFEKFRSPEARRILAGAGQEAMRKDMLAVVQFEKILEFA